MRNGKATLAAWGLVLGIIALIVGGALVLSGVFSQEEPQCNSEPMSLVRAESAGIINQALEYLHGEGAISSVEDAINELFLVGWVLDPKDNYRLEYWLSFGDLDNFTTVGFEMICFSPTQEVVWNYDGVQPP